MQERRLLLLSLLLLPWLWCHPLPLLQQLLLLLLQWLPPVYPVLSVPLLVVALTARWVADNRVQMCECCSTKHWTDMPLYQVARCC